MVVVLCDSSKHMWQMGGSFRDDYLARNFMLANDGIPEEGPYQWPCLVVEDW